MRRFSMLQQMLQQMGIEPQRLKLVWASAAEGQQLAEAIDEMTETVRQLGPLHWGRNWEEDRRAA